MKQTGLSAPQPLLHSESVDQCQFAARSVSSGKINVQNKYHYGNGLLHHSKVYRFGENTVFNLNITKSVLPQLYFKI